MVDSLRPDAGDPQDLFVAGVGASAGGLEALKAFVTSLEPSPNVCFVVAQHLSPKHASVLAQLLQRETVIPVVEAEDMLALRGNHIYVTPPHADVTVKDGVIRLGWEDRKGPSPSVDILLRSIAVEYRQRAIGIVLSGTGADGASGVVAIKKSGGRVLAQTTESARYLGMPQAAIATGCVDVILSASELAGQVKAIVTQGDATLEASPTIEQSSTLTRVLDIVLERTGVSFHGYKPGTVLRRLQTRMAIVNVTTLGDYLKTLEFDFAEAALLQKSILIPVTCFFRDSDHFNALRAVIEESMSHGEDSIYRVWVPGCATGEEVYTLAIMLAEIGVPGRLQVFGTDLEDDAIAFARRAVYPESAVQMLDAAIIEKYFRRVPNGYQVERTVRDPVVFSRHDLMRDPPFLNLDLVSCRNVQIYFNSEAQASTLRLFHAALKPRGILFLGKSESISYGNDLFEDINRKHHIYRNRSTRKRPSRDPVAFVRAPRRASPASTNDKAIRGVATPEAIESILLHRFAPPSVIVDEELNVLQAYGDISRYLKILPGRADLKLTSLVPKEIQGILRAQFLRVKRIGSPDRLLNREVQIGGELRNIQVTMSPLRAGGIRDAEEVKHLYLVMFEDKAPAERKIAGRAAADSDQEVIDDLQTELASLRESLQTAVEELETSNEELQLLNEELQSSNEELEASNEEMQSTNEELITVNDELTQTTLRLGTLVSDLENIQNSVGMPLVVLDEDMNVMRFNEYAGDWMGLNSDNISRPLHLRNGLMQALPLRRMIARVLAYGKAVERQIAEKKNKWLVRIRPYRGELNGKRGVILAAIDITELTRAREALLRSQTHLRQVADQLEMTIDCLNPQVALLDANGTIISVNEPWRRFARSNGVTDASCGVGQNYLEICENAVGPEREQCLAAAAGIREVLRGEALQFVYEYPCHGPGVHRWFRCMVTPARTAGKGAVMMHTEVTERVRLERDSRMQVAALESVPIGVFIANEHGEIQWANSTFARMAGYSAQELQGQKPNLLRSNRNDLTFWDTIWECVREGQVWRGEVTNQSRDGGLFTVQQTVNPIFDSDGRISHFVAIQEDITSRKETEMRILHMAQHDALTGLANRALFHERLRIAMEWAVRRNRQVALMLLDLDQFKDINDMLGHLVGDSLLVAVARRLETKVRAIDMLARMGGDEFAILLEDIGSRETLGTLAERVLEAFVEPFEINGHRIQITASLGIAIHPDDSVGVDGLFRASDLAMYKAKGEQGNSVRFYDPETDLQVTNRARLAKELRAAFDAGQLWVALQPQVELATGKVVGAEALLRISQGELGNEPTSKLIQVAEDSGVIHDLGEWVLGEVASILVRWKDSTGTPVPLAVNLSAMQLAREFAVESILELLRRRQIPHGLMEVEITESVLLQNSEAVRTGLRRLADHGVSIVLDDFGTGYSSLAYLRQHPVRCLKIDISFVQGLGLNTSDEEIVAALIDLAHALGIRVCAEGVETEQQAEFLRQRKCDLAQGYYFGRPLPVHEFEELLRSNQKSFEATV